MEEAQKVGAVVVSTVVENRHGNKDIHNVPSEALERQEKALRDSIKLR